MKHKKLFIILAVFVIMATFTISTFAQVPREYNLTGYTITSLDDEGYTTDDNTYISWRSMMTLYDDSTLTASEIISFVGISNDYYVPTKINYFDSQEYNAELTSLSTDAISSLIVSYDMETLDPGNAIIYYTREAIELISTYHDITYEELTISNIDESTSNGIYQDIYDLIHQYVFGGGELSANAELVTMLTATWGCIFLIALPFVILWALIKLITR